MISEQNWPKHKKIQCKNVQFKIGLNAKCAIVQNWPVHGKPVQNDDQYKFGTDANSAGTKQSVQNVPVQIGQNKVSTSHFFLNFAIFSLRILHMKFRLYLQIFQNCVLINLLKTRNL